jgi:hypothetical protein
MNVETERRILAALAAHGGVLLTSDAERDGIKRINLTRAADAGLIHRTGRGRYVAAGGATPLVATRAQQPYSTAVLSHRGAAFHHGLDGVGEECLEWSVPHGSRAKLPNVYQRRRFEDLDIVNLNGLWVTSVSQTLADLGAVTDVDIVERAAESALRLNLVDEVKLREFAETRVRDRPGGATLRAALARRPLGARPTGSDLETVCLQVYRAGGVPTPQRQYEVYAADGTPVGITDFGWPPLAFVTEVDGLGSHGTETGMQYDYSRQARMEDLGYRFRRHTRTDVLYRHRYVCSVVLRGLARAALL